MRRYFRGLHPCWVQAARVVADDDRGLLLWIPVGAGFACRVDAAGQPLREASLDIVAAAPLASRSWEQHDILILVPPGVAHSVWWFFADGDFRHWYVNMEQPSTRWSHDGVSGLDTVDHALDIVVTPDRTWRWKDEDALAAFTGQPGFWTAAESRAIRAEGERMVAEITMGGFPFDGTWCGFRPEPDWSPPALAVPALTRPRMIVDHTD